MAFATGDGLGVAGAQVADDREALIRESCEVVDATARGRVLVVGSPPPSGTDLDLLVRPGEEQALRAGLRDAGFLEGGKRFVRFGLGCGFEIELLAAEDWALPRSEMEALFAEATPLPGCSRLVEPAPHHQLLILATRLLGRGDPLSDRRKARIDRAVAEDPDSWKKAKERLSAWGDSLALERLRAARLGLEPGTRDRLGRAFRRLRDLSRRRRIVVSLSGIDGSGKSLQVEALQDALADLGVEVAVEWIPLADNPWIESIRKGISRVLARLGVFQGAPKPAGQRRGSLRTSSSMLRSRSSVLTYGWATLVGLANGFSHAYRVFRNRARGKTTIFDRYVLDSVVRLRFFYGEERALRLSRALIRILSPRTTVAFFLDVPAEVSVARKDDGWHIDELGQQVRLYREEQARLGVAVRLDGERPAADLAVEIAASVWRELR